MVLQLYNLNKEKIEGLTKYKDLKIESTLYTGDKVLSFSYPKKYSSNILEEGYIRTKEAEFVIKQIDKSSDSWITVTCSLNVEELESMIEDFDSTEQPIENCINFALSGTGWTVNVDRSITKRRTVRKTNSSIWDIIQQAKKTYRVEIEFDTISKIVVVKEKTGGDKGVYFTEELNLKSLSIQSNSYDFYTRILAIGKDDLKVEVENYSYSNKRKTLIWKDERYTDETSLREDATLKLNEISKPYRAYSADVIDLAKLNEKYKDILSYKLGDTITLISKENGIKEKQRIVKTVEYPDDPSQNTVEIANTTLSFEDVQKEFQDTSDTVNNITEDDGTISERAIKETVKKLTVDKINVQELNAVIIRVGNLEATKANITDLTAINAKIANLQADKANITDLTATNIKFNVGTGGTLDLQTLLSKFVTGENGQFLNITSSNVVIANATIKDAMIENLSLNKLKAGTISTNKFNISSDDGGITIVGPTMQFKDKSNKVRIQMGQDTQGNFNFILRGEDGTTTLIDHTGIKEKAIADDLIKSNMVAENAIGEKQINYSSLITGLNKDTNTSLIQASKVAIDLTGQSLDVVFNSLKSSVDGINSNVESNTTSITAAQGKIDGLIKESSITKGDVTTLKDKYTSIKATVDGISTTVASHTSSIGNLTSDLSGVSGKVDAVDTKVASIETNLSSITQRVSSTESNISTINGNVSSLQSRMSSAEQKITDSAIISTVQATINTAMNSAINSANSSTDSKLQNYATKASMELTSTQLRLDFSSSCGYNLLKNGSFLNDRTHWSNWGNQTLSVVDSDGGYGKCIKITTTGTNQGIMQNVSNLEKGKTYTLSAYVKAESGVCAIQINNNSVTWHNAYTSKVGSWQWLSVTFAANATSVNVEIGRNGGGSNGVYYYTAIMLQEGSIRTAYSPHPNEIYSGSTVIDGSGVTIKNGAINIKNNAGATVFSGDSNGNLKLSIFNSVFEMSATGDRKTQMTCDVLDKFHIKVPFQNAGAGFKLETDTGKTLIEATAGTDYLSIPYYTRVSSLTVDSGANVAGNFAIKKTKMTHDSGGKFVMNIPFDLRNEGFLLKTSTNKNLIEITSGGDGALNIPIWTRLSSLSVTNAAHIAGNFSVGGSKNSLQETKNYGERLINAYETAEYYFGDIGSGVINSDGECLIYIDDILQECINTECEYHVFTQAYNGSITKIERHKDYFIVFGDKNTEFSWELKAKRIGYENVRLDTLEIQTVEDSSIVEDILIEELDFKLEDILMEV